MHSARLSRVARPKTPPTSRRQETTVGRRKRDPWTGSGVGIRRANCGRTRRRVTSWLQTGFVIRWSRWAGGHGAASRATLQVAASDAQRQRQRNAAQRTCVFLYVFVTMMLHQDDGGDEARWAAQAGWLAARWPEAVHSTRPTVSVYLESFAGHAALSATWRSDRRAAYGSALRAASWALSMPCSDHGRAAL